MIKGIIRTEYSRHAYIKKSPLLLDADAELFARIASDEASDADWASSLEALCRMLRAYHQTDVILLVDEYDAPVMAGYTNGYYQDVVGFLKSWLTGALKGGGISCDLPASQACSASLKSPSSPTSITSR